MNLLAHGIAGTPEEATPAALVSVFDTLTSDSGAHNDVLRDDLHILRAFVSPTSNLATESRSSMAPQPSI
jgi:hypothetical protein